MLNTADTPLGGYFLNVGFGEYVQAPLVIGLLDLTSKPGRNILNEARARVGRQVVWNLTHGRTGRTLIPLSSGHFVVSALRRETLFKRLQALHQPQSSPSMLGELPPELQMLLTGVNEEPQTPTE